MRHFAGGRSGPYAPEMKAVFSIVIKGTISTRCSEAMSSSSSGVTDVLKDCGNAIGNPKDVDKVTTD
jgi:hypothetical protein